MAIEVGRRLREARRSRRLTQARVASRAGVSRETVYRIESGRMPTADVATRLCDAIGLERDELDLARPETDAIVNHPAVTGLRDRRRQMGLTLADCAAAAGVSVATLSRFERGDHRSVALVRSDAAGWPVELVNTGLAGLLGFRDTEHMTVFWRTGRF